MSLLALPNELLEMVCNHLFQYAISLRQQDVRTMHSLCLTSKYLYKTSVPHLYRRICISLCDVYLLARSIANDPGIALLTKEVQISNPKRYDIGKAYTLLRKPGLVPPACTRHLHPGKEGPISIVLLEYLMLNMRNVGMLSICLDSISDRVKFFDHKKWKLRSDQLLPAARDFELFDPVGKERYNPFAQVQHMLPLPALRSMNIELACPLVMPETNLNLLTLEVLDITCEGMRHEDFAELLENIPNIRSFTYYGGSAEEADIDDWAPVYVRDIIEYLQKQHKALTNLAIHYYHDDLFEPFLHPREFIGDLRAFTKLKDLDLDFDSMLDPDGGVHSKEEEFHYKQARFLDKLPRSVETLQIFKADDRVVEGLKNVWNSEWKTRNLPHLKTIILEYYCSLISVEAATDEELHKSLRGLRDALKEVDVQLVMR